MTMTSESETTTKPKRGRPFGIFGPRKRQIQLIKLYVDAFGGTVTPIQERDITRAVALQSIAEQKRVDINKNGASSANELLALARLEEVADAAVRRLKLPITTINTGAAA
jgi:hypothetical protein